MWNTSVVRDFIARSRSAGVDKVWRCDENHSLERADIPSILPLGGGDVKINTSPRLDQIWVQPKWETSRMGTREDPNRLGCRKVERVCRRNTSPPKLTSARTVAPTIQCGTREVELARDGSHSRQQYLPPP